MATEPILTIDLDWTSKTGSADATIGFGETFDLRLTGFGITGVNGYLWLTLLQDSVPSDDSDELWSYKTPNAVQSDADGVVVLDNLCIFTQEVEDVLRSQGGKSKLYLAIREMRDGEKQAIDYGVVRLTVAIGSYIKDPSAPEQLNSISIGDLVGKLNVATCAVLAAKDFACAASESARQAVEILEEKQDKLTAGANITITEDGVISATGGGDEYGIVDTELSMTSNNAIANAAVATQFYILDNKIQEYARVGASGGTVSVTSKDGQLNVTNETTSLSFRSSAKTTTFWTASVPTIEAFNALQARVAALEAKLGTAAASVVSGDDDLL